MGTNYYLHLNVCSHCGVSKNERLHIGKSSAGWCFALHVYRDDWRDPPGPASLAAWTHLFHEPSNVIRDQYGKVLSAEEMLAWITTRDFLPRVFDPVHPPRGYTSWFAYFDDNHAEQGPNGMLRHRIDVARTERGGAGCIAHGDGPFDLLVGEFS